MGCIAITDQIPADTLARNAPPASGSFAFITEANRLPLWYPSLSWSRLLMRRSSARVDWPGHPPQCDRRLSTTVGLEGQPYRNYTRSTPYNISSVLLLPLLSMSMNISDNTVILTVIRHV